MEVFFTIAFVVLTTSYPAVFILIDQLWPIRRER